MTQSQREIIKESIGIMMALSAVSDERLAAMLDGEAEILQEMLEHDQSGT